MDTMQTEMIVFLLQLGQLMLVWKDISVSQPSFEWIFRRLGTGFCT